MVVQSVIFKKDKFTKKQAESWLKKNNYKPIKHVHSTDNFHRYRIVEPNSLSNYYTQSLNNGIELVIMQNK
jgi:hypothetical protein